MNASIFACIAMLLTTIALLSIFSILLLIPLLFLYKKGKLGNVIDKNNKTNKRDFIICIVISTTGTVICPLLIHGLFKFCTGTSLFTILRNGFLLFCCTIVIEIALLVISNKKN